MNNYSDVIVFVVVFIVLLIIGWLLNCEVKDETGHVERAKPLKRINPSIIKFGVDDRGNIKEAYQTDNGWVDLYDECNRSDEWMREKLIIN